MCLYQRGNHELCLIQSPHLQQQAPQSLTPVLCLWTMPQSLNLPSRPQQVHTIYTPEHTLLHWHMWSTCAKRVKRSTFGQSSAVKQLEKKKYVQGIKLPLYLHFQNFLWQVSWLVNSFVAAKKSFGSCFSVFVAHSFSVKSSTPGRLLSHLMYTACFFKVYPQIFNDVLTKRMQGPWKKNFW